MVYHHYACFYVYFSDKISLTILRISKYFKTFQNDTNLKRDNAESLQDKFLLFSKPRFPEVLSVSHRDSNTCSTLNPVLIFVITADVMKLPNQD